MAASHDLLQRGPVLIEPPAALDGASGQFHRDSGEFRLSGTSRQALTAQANGQRYELLLATPPGPPPEAGFPVFLVLDADHLFATAVETLRAHGIPLVGIVVSESEGAPTPPETVAGQIARHAGLPVGCLPWGCAFPDGFTGLD